MPDDFAKTPSSAGLDPCVVPWRGNSGYCSLLVGGSLDGALDTSAPSAYKEMEYCCSDPWAESVEYETVPWSCEMLASSAAFWAKSETDYKTGWSKTVPGESASACVATVSGLADGPRGWYAASDNAV